MLPTQSFGHTGHESTRVIFGAAALGSMGQDRADETLELIESYGVNHIDTARSYGESELRLAPWLATNRHKVFLASKTGERTGPAARAELEESLDQAGRRSGRPHPVAQPRRARRMGGRVRGRRSGRSVGQGTRRRAVQVHRGDGSRTPNPVDAPPKPACVRLRLGACFPYNFVLLERPDYRADVEALLELCAQRSVAVRRSSRSPVAVGRAVAKESSVGTSR